VSGLDNVTNTHIGAANPHSESADTNHGNEAHSSNFAVDGATQPPENHGNGAHIESYITSGEAPVQSVNGQTGAVSISARNWETVDTITTDGFTFFETVANYEAIEIDFFFYTIGNTSFPSEIRLFGPDFETEESALLWDEGTGLSSVTPVTGSYRGSVFSNGDDVRVAFRGEAYAQGTPNNTTREDGLMVITDASNDCKINLKNAASAEEIEIVIRGYK